MDKTLRQKVEDEAKRYTRSFINRVSQPSHFNSFIAGAEYLSSLSEQATGIKWKNIEAKLIAWCKQKYSQGDSYNVRVTNKGKWCVSYSNDYPMQHGNGEEFVLIEQDFIDAMKIEIDESPMQSKEVNVRYKAVYEIVDRIGSNVKTLTYNTENEMWTVAFKNGLKPNEIESENLIEFLING